MFVKLMLTDTDKLCCLVSRLKWTVLYCTKLDARYETGCLVLSGWLATRGWTESGKGTERSTENRSNAIETLAKPKSCTVLLNFKVNDLIVCFANNSQQLIFFRVRPSRCTRKNAPDGAFSSVAFQAKAYNRRVRHTVRTARRRRYTCHITLNEYL